MTWFRDFDFSNLIPLPLHWGGQTNDQENAFKLAGGAVYELDLAGGVVHTTMRSCLKVCSHLPNAARTGNR